MKCFSTAPDCAARRTERAVPAIVRAVGRLPERHRWPESRATDPAHERRVSTPPWPRRHGSGPRRNNRVAEGDFRRGLPGGMELHAGDDRPSWGCSQAALGRVSGTAVSVAWRQGLRHRIPQSTNVANASGRASRQGRHRREPPRGRTHPSRAELSEGSRGVGQRRGMSDSPAWRTRAELHPDIRAAPP